MYLFHQQSSSLRSLNCITRKFHCLHWILAHS